MPETPRDDAWLGYLAQVETGFDGLRALVVQLGGLLLLELSRSRLLVQSEPLLPVLEALGENGETLRGMPVPPVCRHAHRHLLACQSALEDVVRQCQAGRAARPAARWRLEDACRHLRWASDALPGLGLVNLSEACCACHPVSPQQ